MSTPIIDPDRAARRRAHRAYRDRQIIKRYRYPWDMRAAQLAVNAWKDGDDPESPEILREIVETIKTERRAERAVPAVADLRIWNRRQMRDPQVLKVRT